MNDLVIKNKSIRFVLLNHGIVRSGLIATI